MAKRPTTELWSYLTGPEGSVPRGDGAIKESAARPDGELVWLHIADSSKTFATSHLARRLISMRGELSCLLTSKGFVRADDTLINQIDDTTVATDRFIEQWQPDLCIWIGGDLDSAILKSAMAKNTTLILVEPPTSTMQRRLFSIFRRSPRKLFQAFRKIFVGDDDTAELLARLDISMSRVATRGAFLEVGALLPANEDERLTLSQSLRARPVWLATEVQSTELEIVLNTHRALMRFALRAILILVPANLDDLPFIRQKLNELELREHLFSTGETPSETTQVLLVDDDSEMGLWYRLSPIALLGSSLRRGLKGQDPNTPAAHGVALLSGPYRGDYEEACQRYADAGALLTVQNKVELSEAIKTLLAPDQAALMARRAWDVGSRGAAMMDAIVDEALDLLDHAGDT